jgi:capsular exopolysaccharide synthesis family protein
LVDYLNGSADQNSIIQQSAEEGLCFIPAGSEVANPSELLSNGKLSTLLNRLTPLFDWVILDSPPCLPVADASVLSNLCDGVILVMRANSTPAAAIQKACQQLAERNIVGVVLNGADESHSYDSSYYYKEK